MHKPAEIYKQFLTPEIAQVCHLLSSDFKADAIHTFLADNRPEKIYEVLLRHKLFPSFYRQWTAICSTDVLLTTEWTQFTLNLRQKAEANRLQMLQKTATLLSVFDVFTRAQIPVLPLKGPVLAFQLYGDVGMKASLDLDILIPKEYFTSAWEVMESLGFSTDFSYMLSPKQKKYLLNSFHHLTFVKGSARVELHWEINTNRYMTGRPNDEYFQKAVAINIADKTIQTLRPDHLTEYLAIHGSYHAWYRLDWLYDFSFAVSANQESISFISENMHRAGLGIIFNQSITLSHLLFGNPLPEGTQNTPSLIRIPLKEMVNSSENAKHKGLSRITHKIYLFKLKKSWKYRFHVFSVLSTNQGNWKMLKLPDRLFFLYFILRPFLYLAQIINAKPLNTKKN